MTMLLLTEKSDCQILRDSKLKIMLYPKRFQVNRFIVQIINADKMILY